MTKQEKKKKFCNRCHYDRYNHPGIQDGGALVKTKECMFLKDSKVKIREIYLYSHQIKPTRVKTLSCFIPERT